MEPHIEPLLPPVATSSPVATPAAPAAPPAAAPAAPTPAYRAGESTPTSGSATSSRPARGRRLAGVVAASVLSATVASVATVGGLIGMGVIDGGPASSGATATSATTDPADTSVTITADDAVVAVAESASPAVVTLTVESAGDGGFDPFSMPSTGVGSGFVFDADGLILTNEHVVEGDGSITVTFQDGSELPGTVIATDTEHDLAVVRVEASGLPTIEIGDSTTLKVGQLVVAIGSPLGTFTESVTSGILSATGRTIEVGSEFSRRTTTMTGLLQTDAAINSGNSGGPLLDASGRVIGVNVAVATSAQGIGFAVPIQAASDIIAEARAATGAA